MKRDSLCAVIGASLVWLCAFPTSAADKSYDAIFSICRAEARVESVGQPPKLVIEKGMGDGGFPIRTVSAEAQQWFNYGLKLFHAFYHEDTKRAFDKAVAADARCAMCLWGQAMSRGPMLNYNAEEPDFKAGLEIAIRAKHLATTPREKLLTAALVERYSRPQDAAAERDFAADLIKAEKTGPSANDLLLIASEVLLTAERRKGESASEAAMALLEPILRRNPRNTAAIHYYIHATEMSGKPALALAYAEQLPNLAPNASHLVHMAAHTYFGVGRFEDAAIVNAMAMRVDAEHMTQTRMPGPLAAAFYYGHNLSFGMAGALMSGDSKLALKLADHLHRAYPVKAFAQDGMSDDEGRRMTIYARFDPRQMLSLAEPSAESPLTRELYHYARGEAYATLRDPSGLAAEIQRIEGKENLPKIGREVLVGRLAMIQGRYADAAQAFEKAASWQETLLSKGMDPPDWWYPIRRSQAAALIRAGRFAEAQGVVEQGLSKWRDDPLALTVLSESQRAQGKSAEARRNTAKAIGLWEGRISEVDFNTI